MAAGTKIYLPAPDSRASFICNIIFTAIPSRFWRWQPTAKPEERPSHEISDFPGGQHGDLHRQEQAAAAPRVAEELGPYRGREESFPHRARPDSGGPRGSQAASDAEQALSAGHDAGAAARLQPDLYRLRTHPRVRNIHQLAPDAGAMPEGGRRVRRSDDLHLRRRTVSLSRTAPALPGNPEARQVYSAMH